MNDTPSLVWLIKALTKLGISGGGSSANALTNATYDANTKLVTYTRSDSSTFTLSFDTLQDILNKKTKRSIFLKWYNLGKCKI